MERKLKKRGRNDDKKKREHIHIYVYENDMYVKQKVYKGVRSFTWDDRHEYNIAVITSARAGGTKLPFSLLGTQKETSTDVEVQTRKEILSPQKYAIHK